MKKGFTQHQFLNLLGRITGKTRKIGAGFTLIELLVVISIIGILAAMVTASFVASQRQARDTQRKSDLSQYRSSIESYASKNNGFYPIYASGTDASGTLCNALNIQTCPKDPKDPVSIYRYSSDMAGVNFVLWATLENVSSTYWVVCSTGQSGKIISTTQISSGSCPAGLTP